MSPKQGIAWLLVMAAAGCQSPAGSLCGKGQEASFGGRTYCYYSKAITEEGFDCPPSLPHQLPLGDLAVCAGETMLPPGLGDYLEGQLGTDGGTTGSCLGELTCAPPSGSGGDQVCVAGRVFDGATHAVIDGTTAAQIEVRLYEPLGFLADTTTPAFKTLTVGHGGLDLCGRYTARFSASQDVPNGLLMVATIGRTGTASAGDYVIALTQARPIPNVNVTQVPAFLVTKTQNATWSTQAGLTDTDFAAAGTLAVRVHTPSATPAYFPGSPIAGTGPEWSQGTLATSLPSYFSDDSTETLTTIAPAQTSTGRDGMVLLRIGKGIGNLRAPPGAAGTCRTAAGAAGQLTITGPVLSGSANGAIVFGDLEATCN